MIERACKAILALVALGAASACGAPLSELDVTTVHVSANQGEYGGYVLVAWQPPKDGSCPSLSARTRVTLDGVRLTPEVLGGRRWDIADGMPALPYRRCAREARFKGPLPVPDGAPKSRVELSDGKKTVVVEVEALRAATRCRLLPPHQEVLVRGQRASLECAPSAFRIARATAAFGPTQYRNQPSGPVEPTGDGFGFTVPDHWSGAGLLTVDVEFAAPVLLCQNTASCVAAGRKILYQTFDVEVR
jgi:hypothetical protein